MITGSQYDAMLNHILKGADREKVTVATGNHTDIREKTGGFGSDIMNNIFDLSSNVREWTTEGNSSSERFYRGGDYNAVGLTPTSGRNSYPPTATATYFIGSRISLYIK